MYFEYSRFLLGIAVVLSYTQTPAGSLIKDDYSRFNNKWDIEQQQYLGPEFLFNPLNLLPNFLNFLPNPLNFLPNLLKFLLGLLKPFTNLGLDLKFTLFTRKNQDKMFTLSPTDTDQIDHFNATHHTRCVIHGFLSHPESFYQLKDDYLAMEESNVIMVAWGAGAPFFDYLKAAIQVTTVGEKLAQLLKGLTKHGLKLSDVHLIGHSLGAHVAGVAGSHLNGELGRITGLDPAFPMFKILSFLNTPLDKSHAKFVDVIHTSRIGLYEVMGHADFYPNGGSKQPGCKFALGIYCSHARAIDLFSQSIINKNAFKSYQCDSWEDFKAGRCRNNKVTKMGEHTNLSVEGKFFLKTSRLCPYDKNVGLNQTRLNSTLDL